nr:MAG: replication initiation protein [Microvirus sp.]
MTCFHPIAAWRSTENTPNGKKRIVFKQSENSLLPITLPCGRCIGCKLERSLMWAIRSVHEAQLKPQNCFITLTYAPEHLPSDGSLLKSHFQTFMKSLRKDYPPRTIRYFMCGEYGTKPQTLDMLTAPGKLHRPHYHACLFGIDFPDKIIHEEKEGILLYTSEILTNHWDKGFCTIGELNFDTAAYTARYITKKITGDLAADHYTTTCPTTGQTIHLEPEYTTMSRRPGLAKEWYEKYKSDIYPSDFLIYQGKTIKTPRYYDNIYDVDDPEALQEIKHKRKARAKTRSKDSTPERLAVREKIQLLNFNKLIRSYENEL